MTSDLWPEFALGVVFLHQVPHDGTGLKHAQSTTVVIDNSRNSSIGIDLQEPVLLLFVGADVYALNFVVQAQLLQDDVRLPTWM